MKKSLVILFSFILLTSCVDSLDDYNVDTKKATVVPAVTLFSNSLKGLIDAITTPNVSNNNFRLYVQQWAETTYLDEQRYNLTARAIPQALWQSIYRDVISDLTESRRLINADPLITAESKANQLAQIEIIEVLSWSILVNTFGDIPYTEAMNPLNPLPKFDDAKTVYYSLLDRLDAALAQLNTTGTAFAAGDLIYKGDISKWRAFGNSLKLRLALVIADSDAAKAKTLIAAAAPNVFKANTDKAAFPYVGTPPNYNPVAANLNSLYTTRQDYVVTSVFVDPMNELNDPRRSSYFTTVGGVYKGGNYGFANTYADFSKVGTKIVDPTLEGLFMDYSEVEFGLAEAIERGFITGDAADHYNKAITASITYWGGTAADASTYLAQPKVAYATATGDYKQKIGFQKWLALYNRGWESWVEWRRLDYPKLLPPTGGSAPAGLQIPVRIIYPINEQTLNGANLKAAATAIGGDLASTKLWWDKF
ncbi:SusD/RagB family nutrient-binding outer membrane lipoprotein [Dyadobacter subterraneus]|uniref:SusD/RagB family nutrient-binding outer membrane lipoprotein n=1 Tax=Dyadobacter subterraneus TaxID=2773304 RepID=A0ABR9WKK1_9BACT|nr:SusD/RagB family nutrient-binding outer membrane lipoprotein [Dyadobacter subterraneus]MBE9464886.1 SusD/RagB family nutrient-binding outer membrane lipoprotein [Dyadobacter subterraneus]